MFKYLSNCIKDIENHIYSLAAWRSARMEPSEENVCSLCFEERHLTRFLHLCVADRWWGQAVYQTWWPSLIKDLQTEHA